MVTLQVTRNSKWNSKLIRDCPSRKHIGNIDDSLMLSTITSMMHELYIEQRTH